MGKLVDANPRYCLTPSGLIKVIQLIFAAIVLCLLLINPLHESEKEYPLRTGEEFTVFTAALTAFFTLLFLVTFFLGCHRAACAHCKCYFMVYCFNALAAVMWFISAAVETWMATRFVLDSNKQWIYRLRAAAAAFCYAEGLLYLASLFLAKYQDL